MAFDLVVVGHFSQDKIITPDMQREEMGGVPAYSLFLTSWGLKLGIVSKCSPEFLMRYGTRIRRSGAILAVSGQKTTEFTNIYRLNGTRTQEVGNVAGMIRLTDFPEPFYKANVVHFGPIIGELNTEIIRNVHSVGLMVSLDLQGFCRGLDGRKVIEKPWNTAEEVLPYVHVLKTTSNELMLVATSNSDEKDVIRWIMDLGTKIVIVTRGSAGASIFTESKEIVVPALPTCTVDPTGAGDVFVLAFLATYIRSDNILDAAVFGTACAALTTEEMGPPLKFEQKKLDVMVKIARKTSEVRNN